MGGVMTSSLFTSAYIIKATFQAIYMHHPLAYLLLDYKLLVPLVLSLLSQT